MSLSDKSKVNDNYYCYNPLEYFDQAFQCQADLVSDNKIYRDNINLTDKEIAIRNERSLENLSETEKILKARECTNVTDKMICSIYDY